MTIRLRALGLLVALLTLLVAGGALAQRPSRLQPTRVASIGDSITRAFDSNGLADNPSESWVNGYFNQATQDAGFENVNSHYQRIDAAFGATSNVLGAVNGARIDDMVSQAQAILPSTPYYVTVELGGNDICRDSIAEVPSLTDYINAYIDGVFVLDSTFQGGGGGLTPGSTVYTAAIPDVKSLYDIGKDETGIFGIDCEIIWLGTYLGFPCGSMLAPTNTEADRLALQQVNASYNYLLSLVVDVVNQYSLNVYWDYTWFTFYYRFSGEHISSIDCFHPSTHGQRVISHLTWIDGPFSAF